MSLRFTAARARAFCIRAVLGVLLAGVLMAPSAASAAMQWVPGPTFAKGDRVGTSPVMATNALGDAYAIWGVSNPNDSRLSDVVAQRVAADGTRGPRLALGSTLADPMTLNPDGTLDANPVNLSIVATPGGAVAMWMDMADPAATTATLKYARLGPAGVLATKVVSTAAGVPPRRHDLVHAPAIATNASGQVLVAWWEDGKALVRLFSGSDVPVDENGPAELAKPYGGFGELAAALPDDGKGVVAYRDNRDGLTVARLGKKDGIVSSAQLGDGLGAIMLDAPVVTTNGIDVGVGRIAAGGHPGDHFTNGQVILVRVPPEGGLEPVTLDPQAIVSEGDSSAGALQIGMDAGGAMAATWGQMSDDAGKELLLSRWAPGAAAATTQIVTTEQFTPRVIPGNPQIAVAPDGTAVVGWSSVQVTGNTGAPSAAATVFAPGGTAGARWMAADAFPIGPAAAAIEPRVSAGQPAFGWKGFNGSDLYSTYLSSVLWRDVPDPPPGGGPSPTTSTTVPAPAPATTPPSVPAPASTVPVVSAASLSKRSIAVGGTTKLNFALSQAGSVRVVIGRPTTGRRVSGACKPQTRKNKKRKRCTYTRVVRTLTGTRGPGRTSLAFNGRDARGRRLAPGRYTATITVTGVTGARSKPVVLTFKITRSKRK